MTPYWCVVPKVNETTDSLQLMQALTLSAVNTPVTFFIFFTSCPRWANPIYSPRHLQATLQTSM